MLVFWSADNSMVASLVASLGRHGVVVVRDDHRARGRRARDRLLRGLHRRLVDGLLHERQRAVEPLLQLLDAPRRRDGPRDSRLAARHQKLP
jgi:hypothetical protein